LGRASAKELGEGDELEGVELDGVEVEELEAAGALEAIDAEWFAACRGGTARVR
jgi:hypothetical protein